MNNETKLYVKQWIAKANEDLLVVDKLTEFQIIAKSAVCFHCQQAVEKFLKAFLISRGIDIHRTHNIEFLLSECAEIDSVFSGIDPKNLSDFGVDVRYPGDLYEPSEDEVSEYKEIAFSIQRIVSEKLPE
ncbi:MAG: HEPN domain-containing protein [Bacteroidota bacterium]